MNLFNIPFPFHICVDDVGWFCGFDRRDSGGPSSTGIGRSHCAEDYIAIEELGKATGMNLSCGYVLAEWDMEDNLSYLPNFSKYGQNWQNSKFRNKKEIEEIAEIINSSPHNDVVLHGLLHGYYKEGIDNYDSSDYFYRINHKLFKTPDEEIRERINRYFYLLEYHGIKKDVNQFIPPSFTYRAGAMDEILKSFGISYICTIFDKCEGDITKEDMVQILGDTIYVDRHHNPIPWDKTNGFDEKLEKVSGILGIHWPNFLCDNPKDNHIAVKNAAKYINECTAQFNTVAAKTIKEAAMQFLFEKYTVVSENQANVSSVPKICGENYFFINSQKPIKAVPGADFEEVKKHTSHITYKITPKENILNINF